MDWLMNRNPTGQFFVWLGMGCVFGRHWEPWIGFALVCVGVGVGLVSYCLTKSETRP